MNEFKERTMRELLESGLAQAVGTLQLLRKVITEGGYRVISEGGITSGSPLAGVTVYLAAPIRDVLGAGLTASASEAFYMKVEEPKLYAPTMIDIRVPWPILHHGAVADELAKLTEVAPQLPTYLYAQRLSVDYGDYNYMLPGYSPSTNCIMQVVPELGATLREVSWISATSRPAELRLDSSVIPLDAPLWKAREISRFHHLGEYRALPPELTAKLPMELMLQEFPHYPVKPGNAGLIAYTQSPTAGVNDRQQVMKVGRYLRRVLPNASDEEIKQLVAEFTSAGNYEILHTKDADKIAEVYMHGPSSCMSYDEDRFGHLIVNGEFFHPTRVYAHPDNNIELVYVVQNGRYIARTLINTKTKTYPRIYGTDFAPIGKTVLTDYLDNLGYTQHDSALSGEKLLLVNPDAYTDAIICPYIDQGNLGVEVYDDYLIVDGSYSANHETGCLSDYDVNQSNCWSCSECNEDIDEDEESPTYPYDTDQPTCQDCIERHYVYAYHVTQGFYVYVQDDNCDLYDGQHTRHNEPLYIPGSFANAGVLPLSTQYYDPDWGSQCVADPEDCVPLWEDSDEYVLATGIGSFGLVLVTIDGEQYAINPNDYVLIDGEVEDVRLADRLLDRTQDGKQLIQIDDDHDKYNHDCAGMRQYILCAIEEAA